MDDATKRDGTLLRVARRVIPAAAATTTAPLGQATGRPRSAHRSARSLTGSVCAALARRETDGKAVRGERACKLPRAQWALSSVMQREENLVLLGFSSDGHFLMYYSWWESCFELQWKQVVFGSRNGRFVGDHASFCLPVGTDAAAFGETDNAASLADGVGSILKIWQSRDDALVIAFATDRHTSQESSQTVHVSVAPSPACDGSSAASDITSLRFTYNAQSPCQEPESWQLLQFSPREHQCDYHLVINVGTAVMILVFSIVKEYHNLKHSSSSVGPTLAASSDARGSLGARRFAQSAWYSTPEFPVEFEREVFHRKPRSKVESGSFSVAIECSCQQNFEVETFLQSFLNKYASLCELNLVDYDLQLLRVSEMERTLFMSCVMELGSSTFVLGGSSHQMHRHVVMALFFSLDITTGEHVVIRALKLPPRQQNLRQLSKSMANKYKMDIDSRMPARDQPAAWSNSAVAQERSLLHLHNPWFPVSIHLHC